MKPVLAALTIAWAGCVVAEAPGVGRLEAAIGEPKNGFPSAEERLGIMAINRARSDPQTVKGPKSTVFPARPPVTLSYDLSRASRFHATSLLLTRAALMHTSPCALNPNVGSSGCDGAPNCACATPMPAMCQACAPVAPINTCGTPPLTRIGLFTKIGNGEVAAAGFSDAWATVQAWIEEPTGADGHRKNLLDQAAMSNTMGFGHAAGGGGCWSSFDVSDSGNEVGQVLPLLPTAAIKPARPPAGTARIYATWADPASGAPRGLWAVLDGTCTPMQKELGTPTLNSTWFADVNTVAGCHRYAVFARDARGNAASYPTTGAIYVSVAGAACPLDFDSQAPIVRCDGQPQPDLASAPSSADLALTSLDGGGTVDKAHRDDADDPDDDGGATGPTSVAGGCQVGGGADSSGLAVCALAALLLVRRRARG